jgi:hypothetical protein
MARDHEEGWRRWRAGGTGFTQSGQAAALNQFNNSAFRHDWQRNFAHGRKLAINWMEDPYSAAARFARTNAGVAAPFLEHD